MLKYLRIAVTTLSLTACAVLIALWVRSISMLDQFHLTTANRITRLTLLHGELKLATDSTPVPGKYVEKWGLWSERFEHEVILPPMPSYAALGFSFTTGRYVHAIGVPIWFLVLPCIALAIVPWLRCRFSLRTLLIAATLAAVVLGIIVVAR
jgi:hypothetical protein